MKIALDAFGSDKCPLAEVEGAIVSIQKKYCDKVFLVGKQDILEKELAKYSYDKSRIEIVHADQTITMGDEPSSSVRTKKDSSLMKVFSLHKKGIVDAAISAGNTGAAMAGSLFTYGRIKNVLRPAIATVFPTEKNPVVILDVGANVECQPANLLQFAELGSLYSKFFFNNEFPKVSLLNIGGEAKKGNEIYKKTYELLSENKNVNFIGNIEGKELFLGKSDVVVCDGFSGNILLKTVEGTVEYMTSKLKSEIKKHFFAKIAILLFMGPVLKNLKKEMDHSEYGGALLVGLNGITVITHGSSNFNAIANSIKFATKIVNSGFMEYSKNFFEGNSEELL